MSKRKVRKKSLIVIRSQFATNVVEARAQNLFNGCATITQHNNNCHRSRESIATNGTVWMENEEEDKDQMKWRRCGDVRCHNIHI